MQHSSSRNREYRSRLIAAHAEGVNFRWRQQAVGAADLIWSFQSGWMGAIASQEFEMPVNRWVGGRTPVAVRTTAVATLFGLLAVTGGAWSQTDDDRKIADSLAAMLRAGRTVISANQARINDPALGPKGLDGATVLARSIEIYQQGTGIDPRTLDPASRLGRLLGAEMAAISEVMDANQASIDAPGTGFKGFIPAVFARLVSEAFSRRANGEAELRVTAPPNLVRNRKARPDAWEAATIQTKFLAPGWPTGQSYEERTEIDGKPVFRIAVPEYYAASCLSCHGGPRGETDLTGYPKEGAALGDLGGVISIRLSR